MTWKICIFTSYTINFVNISAIFLNSKLEIYFTPFSSLYRSQHPIHLKWWLKMLASDIQGTIHVKSQQTHHHSLLHLQQHKCWSLVSSLCRHYQTSFSTINVIYDLIFPHFFLCSCHQNFPSLDQHFGLNMNVMNPVMFWKLIAVRLHRDLKLNLPSQSTTWWWVARP